MLKSFLSSSDHPVPLYTFGPVISVNDGLRVTAVCAAQSFQNSMLAGADAESEIVIFLDTVVPPSISLYTVNTIGFVALILVYFAEFASYNSYHAIAPDEAAVTTPLATLIADLAATSYAEAGSVRVKLFLVLPLTTILLSPAEIVRGPVTSSLILLPDGIVVPLILSELSVSSLYNDELVTIVRSFATAVLGTIV